MGSCCVCGIATESEWGTAIGNPHFVCDECGNAALEEANREQERWLDEGRCTCCGEIELSSRAGGDKHDQLCEACIWPA